MKKELICILSLAFFLCISGCGSNKDGDAVIIGGADGPTSIYLAPKSEGEDRSTSGISVDQNLVIPGTWQTASMAYEVDGILYPEYHVQFSDAYINYGHMIDGVFTLDHSDSILLFEKDESDEYKVQAVSSNGVQYTYKTSDNDTDMLEYYETWNEEEYPEMYRGGASLTRCDS